MNSRILMSLRNAFGANIFHGLIELCDLIANETGLDKIILEAWKTTHDKQSGWIIRKRSIILVHLRKNPFSEYRGLRMRENMGKNGSPSSSFIPVEASSPVPCLFNT